MTDENKRAERALLLPSIVGIDNRTIMSEDREVQVRGAEFINKVEDLGKTRKVAVKFVPRRGKGSHGTLFFGKRYAIVGSLKKELKTGTVHGMLKQLGIKSNEL